MKIFDIFAVGVLLAMSANLLVIFFSALFLGECVVTVNGYGEALPEAIIFPLWFAAGVITMFRMIKNRPKRIKQKAEITVVKEKAAKARAEAKKLRLTVRETRE